MFSLIKQLREDVQSVFSRDPAARNTLEVIINYPGIHAIALHRVAYSLKEQHAPFLRLAVF